MNCPICNQPSSRLVIRGGVTACATCRGLSATGGPSTNGILTRNSDRVREQQHTNEGDLILPHRYDTASQKWVPNEDFLERYPEKIADNFTAEEMVKAGYSKPDSVFEKREAEEAAVAAEKAAVEYAPDEGGKKMAEVIGGLE